MNCTWCGVRFLEDVSYCPQCGGWNESEVDVASECAEQTRLTLMKAQQMAFAATPRYQLMMSST